jgi:soluble lytic murein transglycosylase-like protein
MTYLTISLLSIIYGIDTSLAMNIAHIESNSNPKAYSKTGDGGLFQLNENYYKFHNLKWVYDIQINTSLAMKTLQDLKEKCSHKLHKTYVVCYNLGISGAKKIKNPHGQTYYRKLNYVWKR